MTLPQNRSDWVQLAANAELRADRQQAVAWLRNSTPPRDVLGLVQELAALVPRGLAAAAEFLAREPGPLQNSLHTLAERIVAAATVPVDLRAAVAGRLLDARPDDPAEVRPVAAALTRGLTPTRRTERLRLMQRQTASSHSLDVLTESAESRLVLRCPHCGARRGRIALVKHLWNRHRAMVLESRITEPMALLGAAVEEAVQGGAAEHEAVYAATAAFYPNAPPRQVLQAVAARGASDLDAIGLLVQKSAAEDCGVCPTCLAMIPDPRPPLPPAANWADGRVSADGYAVSHRATSRGTVLVLSRPGVPDEIEPEALVGFSPRAFGTLCALPVSVAGGALAAVAPGAGAVVAAGFATLLAGGVYGLARFSRPAPINLDESALTAAWERLTPGIGRSRMAVRFLTRLSRLSIGVGDPATRSQAVRELVTHAVVLAERGPEAVQLLAVVRVLAAADAATLGRDRVSEYLTIFQPVWRGELGLVYADVAAELILTDGLLAPGDTARLGVRIMNRALDAGLTAWDIVTLARIAPWFGRVLRAHLAGPLATLHKLTVPAPAVSVFTLAATDPAQARSSLLAEPELLIDARIPRAANLGPVQVTVQGVTVLGVTLVDSEVKLATTTSGQRFAVQLGPHQVFTRGEVTSANLNALRVWINWRTKTIPPSADLTLGPLHPLAVALLVPLTVSCSLCRTVSIPRTGQLGTPRDALGQ